MALVDEEDFERISRFKWWARSSSDGRKWYAVRTVHKGPKVYMHHEVSGIKPVDHKDGNGLNNQKENLRKASPGQNNMNRRANHNRKYSPYKGVSWHFGSKCWFIQINAHGVGYRKSGFKTAEEAARAYDEKAVELHGEFALLNFPTSPDHASALSVPIG